jgi:hypothetical protein
MSCFWRFMNKKDSQLRCAPVGLSPLKTMRKKQSQNPGSAVQLQLKSRAA